MRRTVNYTIERMFIKNERTFEAGNTPLTDQEIVSAVQALHPNSSCDNVTEIAHRRRRYNYGLGAWSGQGSAQDRGLPFSYEYNTDGDRLPPSSPPPANSGSSSESVNVDEDLVKDMVQAMLEELQPEVDYDKVQEIIKDEVAKKVKSSVEIVIPHRDVNVKIEGHKLHEKFDVCMDMVKAGINICLVGPTGSGKTYLAEQLATALELPFTADMLNPDTRKEDVFGTSYPNADGVFEYEHSPFTHTFEFGGLHLFDEMDNSDPSVLLALNMPLSNHKYMQPKTNKMIEKHPSTVFVAAMNTYGTGPDRMYCGRNQLDEASINRFKMGMVEIDYDKDLELSLAAAILGDDNDASRLCEWAWGVRRRIDENRARRIIGTRNIKDAAALMKHAGWDLDRIRDQYFIGWTRDERSRVDCN